MKDALVANEPLIGAAVLIRDLRLPRPLWEERLVLQAQTGLCEADRLSTLAGGGACDRQEERTEDKDNPPCGESRPTISCHLSVR